MAGFGDQPDNEEEKEVKSFSDLKEMTRDTKDSVADQKLDVGIFGKEKTGKTHFGFSAPDPILFIDTEGGTGPVETKFSDKDIRVAEIAELGDSHEQDFVKTWKNFEKVVREAVALEDEIETVVLDSTSDIWDAVQNYCKVELWNKSPEEKLDQQWDWGEINTRYTNLIRRLIQADFHFIMTAKAKAVYESAGNPTGEYKPKWQKKTGHWVNVVVQNQKRWVGENNQEKEIFSIIEDSRFDYDGEKSLMGTEINWMEWNDLQETISDIEKED